MDGRAAKGRRREGSSGIALLRILGRHWENDNSSSRHTGLDERSGWTSGTPRTVHGAHQERYTRVDQYNLS